MKNSKIAINGFFGRMGQAIYELSLEQKFNVTLGVDKKDKLQTDLNLKLSDNLSKHRELFDVVIDFSLPKPCLCSQQISVRWACATPLKNPLSFGASCNFSNCESRNSAC